MKKLILLLFTILAISVQAQMRNVQGVVVSSEDGEPLAGATVVPVGGQGQGVATDIDGNFSINVPSGVTKLRVSYVGFNTEEVNITSGKMTISLTPSDTKLDEVMVVAFGTAKKQAFTGAAAVVKADDIEKHTTSNVANVLAGSVPGLQMRGQSGAPGADSGSFSIRGIASLYAGTDPLIVVDGAPYDGNLNNITPDDIESVSVLKDAASAALYGARGAGGVVIITTKKGRSDEAKVSADLKWGANSRAIQDYKTINNPAAYYEAYYAQLYNYAVNSQGMSAAAANKWANQYTLSDLQYQVYTIPEGQSFIGLDGKLNPYATLGYQYTGANGTTYYLTPDNWQDMAYRNGFRQEYSVNITGGSDKASYYASLNYLNDEGFIEYSSYDRISARIKGDFQPKRWLNLGVNASYVHGKQVQNPNLDTSLGSTNLMYYTSYIAPIYPAYVRVVEDGQVKIQQDSQGNEAYDYGVSASNYYGLARPFLATGNPLGSNRYNKVEALQNVLNGTFTADLTFTDYLKANITSNVSYRNTNYSDYENAFYGPKVGVNGELYKYTNESLSTNNIQTISYVDSFGKNNVNLMVGHEYFRQEWKFLSATAQGGYSPLIPEINAFANPTTSSSYKIQYNVEGFFASAQYDYDSKYFASASYRRDASSRFAKDHRWGNFWSIGGAWIINKDFFQDVKEINNLKLKASIGQQGNDNLGTSTTSYFYYTDLYSLSKASDTAMSPSFYSIGNSSITWETTTNLNIGLEFGFFDNRLTGEIDWYNKNVSNLLFWLSVPESLGARGYYGNIGTIRNRGIEVTLTGTILRGKDYEWDLSLNFANNATKILSLPEAKITVYNDPKDPTGQTQINSNGFFESPYWYEIGGPLYNYMTQAYAGVNENGEALYYYDPNMGTMGSDGVFTPITNVPAKVKSKEYVTTDWNQANRYTVGCVLPKLFGGFSTSARWKGLDLSLTFDYQIGGKVFDNHYATLMGVPTSHTGNGAAMSVDVLKAWSPENPNSDIPRWQFADLYSASTSDRFLTNASYLNFQSFTVGYTLPSKWFKNYAKLRVYCAGENLCFWSHRKGLDPRYSFSGNTTVSVYSPARTISGGVQVSF